MEIENLTPLSPGVISGQSTINIAIIGCCDRATKSSFLTAISGGGEKLKDNKNLGGHMQLGYTNTKIYVCEDEKCLPPTCFKAYGSGKEDWPMCEVPGFETTRMKLIRHVSFVDCANADILTAALHNGAAIIDGALLFVEANDKFPSPEHLAGVVCFMQIKDSKIVVQNIVDGVEQHVILRQQEAIRKHIEGAVVIPVHAGSMANMDVVWHYIARKIPVPVRDFQSPARMILFRTLDPNKPFSDVDEIQGVLAGGVITQGVFKVGQKIEFRPGTVDREAMMCTPIFTTIVALHAEHNKLQFAMPGGIIDIGTTMDPILAIGNPGQLVGDVGSLPDVFCEIQVKFSTLKYLLGDQKDVSKPSKGESLLLLIAHLSAGSKVLDVRDGVVELQLVNPVCTSVGEQVSLCRRYGQQWRFIGWGNIQGGKAFQVSPPPPAIFE